MDMVVVTLQLFQPKGGYLRLIPTIVLEFLHVKPLLGILLYKGI